MTATIILSVTPTTLACRERCESDGEGRISHRGLGMRGAGCSEPRRLLSLSTHAESPGQRFRIQTWAPYLARYGIDTTEFAFCTPELERLLPLRGRILAKAWHTAWASLRYPFSIPPVKTYDAVLVLREALPLGPPWWERWIAGRGGRPLAYDIDDPLFIPDVSPTNPVARVLRDWGKWKAICGVATVTICVNEMVADYVRPFCRRVEVVPNAIDLDRYPVKEWRASHHPVLGYSGSYSTMRQLLDIREPLEKLAGIEPYALHVLGGPALFALERAPVLEKQWTAETEVAHLHAFDVGLAPAPDNEWNRYKSFVKVLLYMAVGLPVVASAVGLPCRIIRDGENGFLARSPDDWVEKLLTLIRDPDRRARMGRAARQTIERDFALATQLPRVLNIFRALTGG